MRAITTWFIAILLSSWLQAASSQSGDVETAAVAAVVERFHAALRAGNAASASVLLAPDAVVLEGGERESRQHYLAHHLAEDIKFARSVPLKRENVQVTVAGQVAWVSSTSTIQGQFQGKPINLVGAELVVLSRAGNEWLIRAIHWSSRKAK